MSDHTFDVRITDTSLRDGSHHKRHQFTKEEVQAIVAALDHAGVPVIEVTHGDGLGGSSFNYGFSKVPEQELIKIAAETAKEAKIAFLMLPVATALLSLAFVFQRRFYVFDHTIFSLHSLSAVGMMYAVSNGLEALTGGLSGPLYISTSCRVLMRPWLMRPTPILPTKVE